MPDQTGSRNSQSETAEKTKAKKHFSRKKLILLSLLAFILLVVFVPLLLPNSKPSADNSQLLTRDNQILAQDLSTGREQVVYSDENGMLLSAKWAPDSRHIAYVKTIEADCNQQPEITCIELGIITLDSAAKPTIVYAANNYFSNTDMSEADISFAWLNPSTLIYSPAKNPTFALQTPEKEIFRYDLTSAESTLAATVQARGEYALSFDIIDNTLYFEDQSLNLTP